MPRGPRVSIPNGVFHIINRGNRGQALFEAPADWKKFVALLGEYFSSVSVTLYAFCLMVNHFHLIVRAGLEPLEDVMQPLQTAFSCWSNKKYDRVGHVFQGRFKAIPVDNDAYLKHVVRYAHNNPVRAGLVARAEEWEWSSQRAYLDPAVQGPADPSFVLSTFSADPGEARRRYAAFMDSVNPRATTKEEEDPPPDAKGLEELARLVAADHGLGASDLVGPSRERHCAAARERFVIEALHAGFRASEISKFLRRGRSWVSALKSRMGI